MDPSRAVLLKGGYRADLRRAKVSSSGFILNRLDLQMELDLVVEFEVAAPMFPPKTQPSREGLTWMEFTAAPLSAATEMSDDSATYFGRCEQARRAPSREILSLVVDELVIRSCHRLRRRALKSTRDRCYHRSDSRFESGQTQVGAPAANDEDKVGFIVQFVWSSAYVEEVIAFAAVNDDDNDDGDDDAKITNGFSSEAL
ncbi:hypothetical protein T265_11417 [Opisthorchis viverrini]|uniref:Uncharacterized protein n=1 Tax=Opisthorchis viverrini TaxID=6198 RepID=A0A074Z325_OPIVI|nr:hypothetical protein T265_11417 [Opisthorchis viverrini]KER19927.1 hypothetical protein T265_11417 [Opisthorchis viverrini]